MPAAAAPVRAARVRHVCTACGAVAPKWQGRCPGCGTWNSLVEEIERPLRRGRGGNGVSGAGPPPATVTSLATVVTGAVRRSATGMGECDRVLGGGIVPGALILLGGDPGIGKSTLALEWARRAGSGESPALYCAGEESAAQLGMRAARIGCAGGEVAVAAETDLDTLLATIESRRPPLAVIDSIQTVHDAATPGGPGSVSQVREAVSRLLGCAKTTDVPVLLVGHVTKEGAIAGPRTLEHMVDVVLILEGERQGEHRLLRGIKNRFGPTDELGVLLLGEEGIRESDAPGRAFLDEGSLRIPGSALTVTCEGSRPLAVEVQSLVAETPFGLPRRAVSGFDLGRLHVLVAILERRAKLSLTKSDVYLNAVGGVHVSEPATDLAVAMAVASAKKNRPLPEGCAVIGELGLGGEVRRVRRLQQRLTEAAALGMTTAVVPASSSQVSSSPGLRCRPVTHVTEALRLLD
jgi:DNA repair protein RadA/Sms